MGKKNERYVGRADCGNGLLLVRRIVVGMEGDCGWYGGGLWNRSDIFFTY